MSDPDDIFAELRVQLEAGDNDHNYPERDSDDHEVEAAPPATKRCCGCKQVLPLDAFARHANRPDGRCTTCLECNREQSRAWRRKNPERAAAHWRAWLAANPERARELARLRKRRERQRRKRLAESSAGAE